MLTKNYKYYCTIIDYFYNACVCVCVIGVSDNF